MNNIKLLEDYIEALRKPKPFKHTNEQKAQAIENLIQENKELKEHLQKYYNGELYTAKQLKNIEENQKKYFIHKSKVKEKIEEIKRNDYSSYDTFLCLQELLEEGE